MENECVGAPCGIMDQMAVTFGAESELLALMCQPAELQTPVAIPTNVRFWGLDSGETCSMLTPRSLNHVGTLRPQRDLLQGRGTAWEAKTMQQCARRLSWACASSAAPRHAKRCLLTGALKMLRKATTSSKAA